MKINYITKYELLNDIGNVLIIGDINYYYDTLVDVEIISDNEVEAQRCLDIQDYINLKKRPLYYKYNNIVIAEKYLDILSSIKYYFSDNNFTLIIIVNGNYRIEENDDIISLFENPNYKSYIRDNEEYITIKIQR